MQRFNVLTGELPERRDRSGYAWRGRGGVARELGLRWFGASVYELPAGQWTFPYHYYPDSDKLGVRPPGGGPDRLDFRRGDAVDYWDGE
jgi:hypothetical protein